MAWGFNWGLKSRGFTRSRTLLACFEVWVFRILVLLGFRTFGVRTRWGFIERETGAYAPNRTMSPALGRALCILRRKL